MDIEKLIERLGENTDCWTDKVHGYADLRLDAATAITDLLVENQSLRNAANGFKARAEAAEARAEKAERALAHMWYAYENKDAEFPHEYEKEAVKEAEQLLGKWEDVMPKLLKEE